MLRRIERIARQNAWINTRYLAVKNSPSPIVEAARRVAKKPPGRIPSSLLAGYTMNGTVPIQYWYEDGSQSAPIVYGKRVIEETCARTAAEELGHYGKVDAWLYEALHKYPITGQEVAIMGSTEQGFGPWYECICLSFGGIPTTIDYNPIDFGDERIKFLKAPLGEGLEPFDAAISASSFEHDGLGRYGDPLDPEGDLKAMRQMKTLVKKGGLLFLTVPVGQDKVIFNVHRIYGRKRLPRLVDGWTVLDTIGFDESLQDRDTGRGWMPTKVVKTPTGTITELLHPEHPEYAPVWVLRND